jgi:3-dehydroquinate dehydratase type I
MSIASNFQIIKDYVYLDSHRSFLASIISASARFKANVVTLDERESGLRGLLNFGHSIGHAYEAALSPAWLHGECVSLGLLHETELSISLGVCSPDVMTRLKKCLEMYHLPVEFDQGTKNKLLLNDVMNTMKVDKKNKGAQKRIVLLSAIGKTFEQKASNVPDSFVESILAKYTSTADDKHIPTKTIHTIANNEEDVKELVSFRLISTQENMRNSIRGLSSILCEKFGLTDFEKNGGSEIECVAGNSTGITRVIYFTSEAGSSQVCIGGYEYVVLPQQTREQFLSHALRFIQNIRGLSPRHVSPHKESQSTFVTPTVSSYNSFIPTIFNQWTEHTDAIEFRVDYLTPTTNDAQDWISTTGAQLALLRQLTNLPIIYTVRTVPQAGKFDPALKDLYYQLVQWGIRWGCDYVDVELTTLCDEQFVDIVLDVSYPRTHCTITKLIASFHDPGHRYSWSSFVINQMYNKTKQIFDLHGHSGVIKLVGYANTIWDNFELEQFRHGVDPDNDKELILINMGPRGKLSRVSNQFLSPATHPTLSSAAAPGQMSVAELASIRKVLAIE